MIRLAGDWIPLQRETWLKPEIMRIGRMSGIPRFHALGIMAAFWSWASGVTVDGHVDATVDDLVDMFETPPNFWECVQSVGWIEIKGDHVKIPRADSWLTNAAKARITKNQRQKRWRDGKAAGDSVDGHVDGHVGAKAPTRREEIREEKNKEYCASSSSSQHVRATAKPEPKIDDDFQPEAVKANQEIPARPAKQDARPAVTALESKLGRSATMTDLARLHDIETATDNNPVEINGVIRPSDEIVTAAIKTIPPHVRVWHRYVAAVIESSRADGVMPGEKIEAPAKSEPPSKPRRTIKEMIAAGISAEVPKIRIPNDRR